jgi:histidyl-tRNA synthetase
VLGPDEVTAGRVTVKNLTSGEQVTVAREAVAETIRGILDA